MADKNAQQDAPAEPELVRPPAMAKFYCEGLSQLVIGYPVSRMLLHDFIDRDANKPNAPERRQLVAELVIPTAGLIELAKHVIASVGASKAQIKAILDLYGDQVSAALASIDATAAPVPPILPPQAEPDSRR